VGTVGGGVFDYGVTRDIAEMVRMRDTVADRCFQGMLIASMTCLSWLLMMVLHEAGHVWHGLLSGAHLERVHLPIMGFSRTDFAANPHPLFVVWGGPLWGCLLPLAILGVVSSAARRYAYLAKWSAGFCLIANGGYLFGGAFQRGGGDDGGIILQHGGARWQLVAFGVVAIASGLRLWNGLGPSFGFAQSRGKVDRKVAVSMTVSLICTILLLTFLQTT
jgi:hypothetical protein